MHQEYIHDTNNEEMDVDGELGFDGDEYDPDGEEYDSDGDELDVPNATEYTERGTCPTEDGNMLITLNMRLLTERHGDRPHYLLAKVKFWARPEGAGPNDEEYVGEVRGHIFDKTVHDSWLNRPSWWVELDKAGRWYDFPLDVHAQEDDGDTLDCFEKELMLTFTKTGEIQPALLGYQQDLSHDKLCFVTDFQLEPKYRGGKPYGQFCMTMFLRALLNLPGGRAFAGTVMLSPGPYDDARAQREQRTGKRLTWNDIIIKLEEFYRKCGFETWLRGNTNVDRSITLMGQVIPSTRISIQTPTRERLPMPTANPRIVAVDGAAAEHGLPLPPAHRLAHCSLWLPRLKVAAAIIALIVSAWFGLPPARLLGAAYYDHFMH